MNHRRILFAAAEMTPIAKAGGMGDVVGSLPLSLRSSGMKVTVALPYHEEISKENVKQLHYALTLNVMVCGKKVPVTVYKAVTAQTHIPLLLFKQKYFLSRGKIYEGHYVLNPLTRQLAKRDALGRRLRYLFFSYALLAYLQQRPKKFQLVHAHDCHVAPVVALLHDTPTLNHIRTVETIHNLAYADPLPLKYWELFQPSVQHLFNQPELLRTQGPRMLGLGIQWADAITTVSPQYAKEILTPEYGNDFELLLQKRHNHLFHILNGIDTVLFNPATDPALHRHFSARTTERRLQNKLFLQKRCGLPVNARLPLIGMVTRLDTQKGINLLLHACTQLAGLRAQFIICGAGRLDYTKALQSIARQYPQQWYVHNAFDTIFSQYVYAGCDIFLMPSRHEPCGLAQLIAMRYGAVPVARSTGGLKDTIRDGYNGFLFEKYSSSAMLLSLQRALKMYQTDPTKWKRLMHNGMAGDYGWKKSALEYAKLYRKLIIDKR